MRRLIPGFKTASAVFAVAVGLLVLAPRAAAAQEDKPRKKAWLGIAVQDVAENVAKKNNLADNRGAYVSQVKEDSPADSVGIKKGDIIVEFNQKQIDDADVLVSAVGKLNAGDKVDIVAIRKGEKERFKVLLGKCPRSREFAVTIRRPGGLAWMLGNHTTQGMQLMELNEQLSEYFGVSGGTGVLVEKVEKGSAADKAGIKAGDVLQKIGKRTIDDLEDVSKALRRVEEDDKITVDVLRKGQTKSLTLEVQEDDSSSQFNIFKGDAPDAGWNRIPHVEGNLFTVPGWDDRQLRLKLEDVSPKTDELKERMHDMMQDLNNHRGNIEKSVRMLRIRTV